MFFLTLNGEKANPNIIVEPIAYFNIAFNLDTENIGYPECIEILDVFIIDVYSGNHRSLT